MDLVQKRGESERGNAIGVAETLRGNSARVPSPADRGVSPGDEAGGVVHRKDLELPPGVKKHMEECAKCNTNEDLTIVELVECATSEVQEELERLEKLSK